MTYDEMRASIYDVYDTDSWHSKVDSMSDSQVVAIYLKFKNQGKLDTYLESGTDDKDDKNCSSEKVSSVSKTESLIDLNNRIERLIKTLSEFCINLTDDELTYMRSLDTYDKAYNYYWKMLKDRL